MLRLGFLLAALLVWFPAWGQGSSGTGFAIAQGLVVTNHHVVKGCSSLAIVVPGQGSRPARLIADDPSSDLALVYALGLPGSLAIIRTTPARLGEQVYAFGCPLTGALASSGNFTSGLVSALRGLGDKEGTLQFTAPVQPGNSGGALLDKSGLVIGVVQSKLDALHAAITTGDIPQNVNFAVSGETLSRFLRMHQVNVQQRSSGVALDATAIAERTQGFSFQVSCEGRSQSTQPQPRPSPPPNAAADAERALALSSDEIKNLQLSLFVLGHDPGLADGVIGQATRAAIRSFQRSRRLTETGYLSAPLLSLLRQDALTVPSDPGLGGWRLTGLRNNHLTSVYIQERGSDISGPVRRVWMLLNLREGIPNQGAGAPVFSLIFFGEYHCADRRWRQIGEVYAFARHNAQHRVPSGALSREGFHTAAPGTLDGWLLGAACGLL